MVSDGSVRTHVALARHDDQIWIESAGFSETLVLNGIAQCRDDGKQIGRVEILRQGVRRSPSRKGKGLPHVDEHSEAVKRSEALRSIARRPSRVKDIRDGSFARLR
jgi:hypothetical protein